MSAVTDGLTYEQRCTILDRTELAELGGRVENLEHALGAIALLIEAEDGASPLLKRCAGVIRKSLPKRTPAGIPART